MQNDSVYVAGGKSVGAVASQLIMRYRARWSNGFWKTFDSHRFEDIEMHSTKVDAERAVDAMNMSARRIAPPFN